MKTLPILITFATLLFSPIASSKELKIAYSDWPGWAAWEIAIRKGWFAHEGLQVDFIWMNYAESINSYSQGEVDAVCMTNGDALVTASQGSASVGIIINDYSNGNDKVIVNKQIRNFKDLKGKRVAVEMGLVPHLLFLHGLEAGGLRDSDVDLLNCPTDKTPEVLGAKAVEAISAWQPISGEALENIDGAHQIYSSADAPGLIYDLLFVNPTSLEERRNDWAKIVKIWYKVVDFIKDENNFKEVMKILSDRLNVSPDDYEKFFLGTHILSLDESLKVWQKGPGLNSIYGSSKVVNQFNMDHKVYDSTLDVGKYFDPSLTLKVAEQNPDLK